MNIDIQQFFCRAVRKLFSKDVQTFWATVTVNKPFPNVSQTSFKAKLLGVKRRRHYYRFEIDTGDETTLRRSGFDILVQCSRRTLPQLEVEKLTGEGIPVSFKAFGAWREGTLRVSVQEEAQSIFAAA